MPWVIKGLYNFVKGWIDEKTRSKIYITTNKNTV